VDLSGGRSFEKHLALVRVGAGARAVALAPSLADPLQVVTPNLQGLSLTSSLVDIV
jgi:hypothetical protein